LVNKCNTALLGTATLDVVSTEIDLIFGTFNTGRRVVPKLVDSIAKAIADGKCKSASNPLVVAVKRAEIEVESLALNYNPLDHTPPLRPAVFRCSNPRIETLAGLQRVSATKKALEALEKRFTMLQVDLDKAQSAHDDDEFDPNEVRSDEKHLRALEEAASTVEDLIGRVKIWPVHFYDIGPSFTPSKVWN
jgi:hypothetical protein